MLLNSEYIELLEANVRICVCFEFHHQKLTQFCKRLYEEKFINDETSSSGKI